MADKNKSKVALPVFMIPMIIVIINKFMHFLFKRIKLSTFLLARFKKSQVLTASTMDCQAEHTQTILHEFRSKSCDISLTLTNAACIV
jgi:hypothetical protein